MGEEIQDARRTVPRAILAAGARDHRPLHRRDAERPAGDSERAGVGAAGDHAGDADDDGEGRAAVAGADRRGARHRERARRRRRLVRRDGAAAVRRRASIGSCRRRSAACIRRWRTPYVALLVQAAIAGLFVFLGQAGTSVRGAYDALVSMGIIAYFIPFLFMFAAMIVLQREPAGPEVMRVPGGPPVAIGARGRRLRGHRALDRARVHPAGRRAEQDARGGEGRRGDRWRWSPSASSSTCPAGGGRAGRLQAHMAA